MLPGVLGGRVLRVRLLPVAEVRTLLVSFTQELTTELEEKQDIFRSLQDTAELLSLENHPAKQTVEVSWARGGAGKSLANRLAANLLTRDWETCCPPPRMPLWAARADKVFCGGRRRSVQ